MPVMAGEEEEEGAAWVCMPARRAALACSLAACAETSWATSIALERGSNGVNAGLLASNER